MKDKAVTSIMGLTQNTSQWRLYTAPRITGSPKGAKRSLELEALSSFRRQKPASIMSDGQKMLLPSIENNAKMDQAAGLRCNCSSGCRTRKPLSSAECATGGMTGTSGSGMRRTWTATSSISRSPNMMTRGFASSDSEICILLFIPMLGAG